MQPTSYNPNGRREIKQAISTQQYFYLKARLQTIMQRDENASTNGRYHIRSTYFDNLSNKVLNEKKEGYLNRDKYRVRIYNLSDRVIHLERKSKRNNLTYKSKCTISKQEFEKMQYGEIEWMEHDHRSLLQDLYREMKYSLLKPTCVVDYEREAFMFPYGNVRITFDSAVKSSIHNTNMFDKHLPMVNVLDHHTVILEVKYDEYLPDIIRALLQSVDTHAEAYSKYQLSRMFG